MSPEFLYGEETAKALENFGRGHTPRALIAAYAKVKRACVSAVQETEGRFESELFVCILEALDEVASGVHDAQFPLPIRQGGAGTSFNMNLNEVAAARARQLYSEGQGGAAPPLDPIEDLNRSQSTNDTFPTAVTVAALELANELELSVIALQEALVARELELEGVLLTGRTELQDALPIRLGQVFGAWAGCLERDRWRMHKVKERLRTHALGGTAIGTCFAASPAYMHAAERELRRITGLPLSRSQNLPDEIAHQDKYAELAETIGLCAGNVRKIASDLLLYTSSLSGELGHPELQYGSTIMPAKANPVLLESARGNAIAAEHEARAARDYAFEGQLQLNPYLPFLADCLLLAGHSLALALATSRKLVPALIVRRERIAERLLESNVLLNLLSPSLGYRKVKELAASLRDARGRHGAQGKALGEATKGAVSGAVAPLEAYIEAVAGMSGMPRGEIAARFDAFKSTGSGAEGGTIP